MKKTVLILVGILILYTIAWTDPAVVDIEKICQETYTSFSKMKTTRLEMDRNKDGKIDSAMILEEKGKKLYEELDYNFDGRMDDLCFYTNGVLQRELIDTNFDGRIDLWVYLKNGVYIEKYERDTDYDGVVDKMKQFGQKK